MIIIITQLSKSIVKIKIQCRVYLTENTMQLITGFTNSPSVNAIHNKYKSLGVLEVMSP